jgi:hypothetical protein
MIQKQKTGVYIQIINILKKMDTNRNMTLTGEGKTAVPDRQTAGYKAQLTDFRQKNRL